MKWAKVSTDILTNPKLAVAGFELGGELGTCHAMLLYLHLVLRNFAEDRGGHLTAAESRAEVLAIPLSHFGLDAERCGTVAESLRNAGLVTIEDGCIRLNGWSEEWTPKCSTCRKVTPAPGKKTCDECLARKSARKNAEPQTTEAAEVR